VVSVNVAVLVSGGGTNLRALLDADNPWGRVMLVVSSRDGVGALDRARAAGVETVVVDPRRCGGSFAERLIEVLTSHDIGLVVLAGYLTILPPAVVRAFDHRIVNVHPALLPSFGGPGYYGLRVHEAVLARGVKVTGATVHYVDDVPDGGEIIAQRAVDVLPGDTPATLRRRVMEQAEWVLLPRVVRDLCRQIGETKGDTKVTDDKVALKTLAQALAGNRYPGRGIVVGLTPDGTRAVCAYFVMGRSTNSRNRVFEARGDDVFTKPADPALVEDPSLIIYRAIAGLGATTVVTNGDQTDTIVDALTRGRSFEDALRTRDYEPDGPHFTSRISALLDTGAHRLDYHLSQLRCWKGTTARFFWEFEGVPGHGHLVHTYADDGDVLPVFDAAPVEVAIDDDQDSWTRAAWDALDVDNRISLVTRYIPLNGGLAATRIVNRYQAVA
jgi:phosphoribosylglycinamide formyltransferase-1